MHSTRRASTRSNASLADAHERARARMTREDRAERGGAPARDRRRATTAQRLMFCAVAPVFALSFQLSIFASTDGARVDRRARRSPGFEWGKFMTRTVANARFKVAPGSATLAREKRRTVWLCNHRAWSDFFLDIYLTEGRAFTMSRMLVAYAFPLFMVPAMACGVVFGFKRDAGDKEKLNAALDAHFDAFGGEFAGMVCYPEGTRNVRENSMPLKRGMLRYAHSRKMAVQCVCTARKERVFSSHLKCAERGLALPVYFADVVHAEDYPDFEDFYNEIRSRWDNAWSAANGVSAAEAESLPDYTPREHVIRCTPRHDGVIVSSALLTVLGVALTLRACSKLF